MSTERFVRDLTHLVVLTKEYPESEGKLLLFREGEGTCILFRKDDVSAFMFDFILMIQR